MSLVGINLYFHRANNNNIVICLVILDLAESRALIKCYIVGGKVGRRPNVRGNFDIKVIACIVAMQQI